MLGMFGLHAREWEKYNAVRVTLQSAIECILRSEHPLSRVRKVCREIAQKAEKKENTNNSILLRNYIQGLIQRVTCLNRASRF